jgi:hypothetical protein
MHGSGQIIGDSGVHVCTINVRFIPFFFFLGGILFYYSLARFQSLFFLSFSFSFRRRFSFFFSFRFSLL